MLRKIIIGMVIAVFGALTLNTDILTAGIAQKPISDQRDSDLSLFIVKYKQKEWVLNLKSIGFDGIDPTTLNKDLVMSWFYRVVEKQVNQAPRSAYFKERALVSHVTGQTVDTKRVQDWLGDIHDYINRPAELPVKLEDPPLTNQKVLSLKGRRLSSYTTWFNPWSHDRNLNIRLSANAIDHYIVMPGQVFSFNEVIGRTTSAKGYRAARIIIRGEYKKGLGGGICQTSSTLFNCVDQAGLHIVERFAHSKKVTYVPQNRDATVSWGGPDFKFSNSLNEPILIATSVTGGRITVSIYGSESIRNTPRHVCPAPPPSTLSAFAASIVF